MKKKLLFLVLPLLFLTACAFSNTPTSKVEEMFGKYQTLDNDINDEITTILNEEDLSESQKARYRKILEKQYKNLTYQIKDEIIDGDTAILNVEIEVLDLKKTIDNLVFDSRVYTKSTYNDEKLNRLESALEKVKYTLDITLTKDVQGTWKLDKLSNENTLKIQGMY